MNIQGRLLINAAKSDSIIVARLSLGINKVLRSLGEFFAKLNPFKTANSYNVHDNYSSALNQALSHATKNLNSQMMELFIDNGADVNFTDKNGKSLLDHLAESIVQSTKGLSVCDSVRQISVESKCYPLKERGAKYSAYKEVMVDNFNNYALLSSARDLNYGSIDTYIGQGADINFIDEKGKSALDYVAETIAKSKNLSIANAAQEIESNDIACNLVGRGAEYSKYKGAKYNPNHDIDSDYKVRELVMKRNAKYLERDDAVNRSLLHATKNLNYRDPNMDEDSIFRTIDYYIRQGANVNFIDKQGKSTLDYVAEKIAELKNLSIDDVSQEVESNYIVKKLIEERGARYSVHKGIMMGSITNNPHKGFPYAVDEDINDSSQSVSSSSSEEHIYAEISDNSGYSSIEEDLYAAVDLEAKHAERAHIEPPLKNFYSVDEDINDNPQSVSSSSSEEHIYTEIPDSSGYSSIEEDLYAAVDLEKKHAEGAHIKPPLKNFYSVDEDINDSSQSVSSSSSEEHIYAEISDNSGYSSIEEDLYAAVDLEAKHTKRAYIKPSLKNFTKHASTETDIQTRTRSNVAQLRKICDSGKKTRTLEKQYDIVGSRFSQVSVQPVCEERGQGF